MIFSMKTAGIPSIELLQTELEKRDQIIDRQEQKILHLEEQLNWLKRQIFGKRSERNVGAVDQQQLEIEGFSDQEKALPEKETIQQHERQKPKRNGQDKIQLPSDLPVETTTLDLPAEEKVCKETGEPLVRIGEEVSYRLAHRPGSYYLKEIIRPKYAHPKKEELGVLTALLPDSIIPKCRADESLLAEIAVKKFGDHQPLYRIAEQLGRERIMISRRLLSQWIVRLGMALLPLYEAMKQEILASGNLFIDETPIDIQDKIKTRKGYMWTLVGGRGANPPYRIYDFKPDRKHEHVKEILGNYQGALHSDKYGAYETYAKQSGVIWMPCYSHIRRKFFEAEAGDPSLREWVLIQLRELFQLEELAWLQPPEERLRIRQEQEVPIIDALIDRIKRRLIEGKILPKSKLKEALGYFCSLIPYLKNYTQHPFARLDNNVAERAIRPLAIGRKNWLFFGSEESGQSAAVLLSLIQTCRGLKINPRNYLEDVFRRLMGHSARRVHELLPDQWQKAREPPQ
jgi:transposase